MGTDTANLFDGSCIGTPLASREFDTESTLQDLQRLLTGAAVITEEIPIEAQAAINGLIVYLGLLGSDDNLGIFTLKMLNLSQYMRLDETALKTLNIFPSVIGGKETSLFGILDHCKTRQGSRLLAQWIRQPLLSKELINQRLDVVDALVTESVQRQTLRETVLRGIPDIGRVGRKLIKGKANLQVITDFA
jgi:DNA mismatch repair protein MSH2